MSDWSDGLFTTPEDDWSQWMQYYAPPDMSLNVSGSAGMYPDPEDGSYGPQLGNYPDPGDGSYGPQLGNYPDPGNGTYGPQLPTTGGGARPGGTVGGLTRSLGLPDWLSQLLPYLALGGGALFQSNQTNNARDAMLAANQQAMGTVQGYGDKNAALYAPYVDAGKTALGQMQNFPQSNLSSRYKPLGSGSFLTVGNMAGGR